MVNRPDENGDGYVALRVHALVYELFACNIREHSSAVSVDAFLAAAFTPAASALRAQFGVSLELCVVGPEYVRRVVEHPVVAEGTADEMRERYEEADDTQRVLMAMVLYERQLDRDERPHLLFACEGVPIAEDIDLMATNGNGYEFVQVQAASCVGHYGFVRASPLRVLSHSIQQGLAELLGAAGVHAPVRAGGGDHYSGEVLWTDEHYRLISQKLRSLGLTRP